MTQPAVVPLEGREHDGTFVRLMVMLEQKLEHGESFVTPRPHHIGVHP